jgi:hypothetical protein
MDDDEERARAWQLATVLHFAKKDPGDRLKVGGAIEFWSKLTGEME